MQITVLCAVMGLAMAKPNGLYHQEYNYQTSSSSFKNNELQHKNDDQGYYSKDGDLEGRFRPKVNAHSQHSEYLNPKLQNRGVSGYLGRTSSFGQLHAQNYFRAGDSAFGNSDMHSMGGQYGGNYDYMGAAHGGGDFQAYGVNSNLHQSNVNQITTSIQEELARELQRAVYEHHRRSSAYTTNISQSQVEADRRAIEEELRRNVTMRIQEALKSRFGAQGIRGGSSYSMLNGRLQPTANYNIQELDALTRQMEANLMRQLNQEVQSYYHTQVNTEVHTQRTTYQQPSINYPSPIQQRPIYHSYPQPVQVAVPDSITTVATRVQTDLNEHLNRILEHTQRRYFNSAHQNGFNFDSILAQLQEELRANITLKLDEQIKHAYGYSNYGSKYSAEDIENLKRQIETNLITKLNRDFNKQREKYYQTYVSSSQIYGQVRPMPSNQIYYPVNTIHHQTETSAMQRQLQETLSRQLQDALMRQQYRQTHMYSGGETNFNPQANYQATLDQLSAELNRNLTRQIEQYSNSNSYQSGAYEAQLANMRSQLQNDLMRQLQQGLQQSYSRYSSWSSSSRSSSNNNYRPVRGFDANLYRSYGTSGDQNVMGEDCMMGDDPSAYQQQTQDNQDLTQQVQTHDDLTQDQDLSQQVDDLTQQLQTPNELADLTQHVQTHDDLRAQDLTQQVQTPDELTDLTQQTHDLRDQDLTQQLQTHDDSQDQDLTQQVQTQDLTQQTQTHDKLRDRDLTQQVQTPNDLSYLTQQAQTHDDLRDQDLTQQVQTEDLTQQTQTHDKLRDQDLTQQVQTPHDLSYLTQQVQTHDDLRDQDLTQQVQTEDLTQQIQPHDNVRDQDLTQQFQTQDLAQQGQTQDKLRRQDLTQQVQTPHDLTYLTQQVQPSNNLGRHVPISQNQVVESPRYTYRPQTPAYGPYQRPYSDLSQQVQTPYDLTQQAQSPKNQDLTQQLQTQDFTQQVQTQRVPAQQVQATQNQLNQVPQNPSYVSNYRIQNQQPHRRPLYDAPPQYTSTYIWKPQGQVNGNSGLVRERVQQFETIDRQRYSATGNDNSRYQPGSFQPVQVPPQSQYRQIPIQPKLDQDQINLGQQIDDSDSIQQTQDVGFVPDGQYQQIQTGQNYLEQQTGQEIENSDLTQQTQDAEFAQLHLGNRPQTQQIQDDGFGKLQIGDQSQQTQDVGLGKLQKPQTQLGQQIEDLSSSQQTQDVDFGNSQQPQTQFGQQVEDFGLTQQTEDDGFGKLQIGEQSQQPGRQLQQQTTQDSYRRFQVDHQQQLQQNQQVDDSDLTQQTQDLTQQTQDLTQQTQDLTQQTQDFSQQTQDLTQQTQDLTQQTQDEDFAKLTQQQADVLSQHTQDLTQQTQNIEQPVEPQISTNKIFKDQQTHDLIQQEIDQQQSEDEQSTDSNLIQQAEENTDSILNQQVDNESQQNQKLTEAQIQSQVLIDQLKGLSDRNRQRPVPQQDDASGPVQYEPKPVYSEFEGQQVQVGTTRQLPTAYSGSSSPYQQAQIPQHGGYHSAATVPAQQSNYQSVPSGRSLIHHGTPQQQNFETVREIEPVQHQVAHEVQQVDGVNIKSAPTVPVEPPAEEITTQAPGFWSKLGTKIKNKAVQVREKIG